MIFNRFDSSFKARLYAREPFTIEVQLTDEAGFVERLDGRSFTIRARDFDGNAIPDLWAPAVIGTDAKGYYATGTLTGDQTALLPAIVEPSYELVENLAGGQEDVIVAGKLEVQSRGAVDPVQSIDTAALGISGRFTRTIVRNVVRLSLVQRGARGFTPEERLAFTRDPSTGQAYINEPTVAAMNAYLRAPAIDAATDGTAQIGDALTELGETTSQKIGEVDAKLDGVDTAISGQLVRVDTKLAQADVTIEQAQAVVAQGVALSSNFGVLSVGPAGSGIANTTAWNYGRPSRRAGFDASLTYEEVADNQLQAGYDFTTGAYVGALFAGARTNLVRANRAEGFTAGVLTTGSGKFPTSNGDPAGAQTWALSGTGGLAVEVVGSVQSNGLSGVRFRATGTATSTSLAIHFETTTGGLAAPSKTYTSSFYMRLVAAPNPPTSFRHRVRALTSAGGAVASDTSTVFVPAATVQRFQRPYAFPATSTIARVDAGFGAILVSGNTYDFTFDLFAPQIEEGGFASTFIRSPAGVIAAPSRAEGLATIPAQSISTLLGASGCMIFTVTLQGLTGTDSFGIFSLGDGTQSNVLGLLVNGAGTGVEGRVAAGGVAANVAIANMAALTPGTPFKVALAWDGTNIQVAARGTAGTKIAQTVALPRAAITQAMLGRLGSLNPLFGSMLTAELRPAPSFDSALALLTA